MNPRRNSVLDRHEEHVLAGSACECATSYAACNEVVFALDSAEHCAYVLAFLGRYKEDVLARSARE